MVRQCGKVLCLALLAYFFACSGDSSPEFSRHTSKSCNTAGFAYKDAIAKTLPNLTCADTYSDTVAPYTYAFPARTLAGNYPTTITLSVNETSATTYYTTDDSAPSQSSSQYAMAFTPSSDTTLRYFSTDSNGNVEETKRDTYKFASGTPTIILSAPTSNFLNGTGSTSFNVQSGTAASYQIELEGNGDIGNGTVLETGTLAANTDQTVTIAGSTLLAGENLIYIYVTVSGVTSYSSLYLYRDDNPPFVQSDPDEGLFNYQPSVTLFAVEPTTIRYTTDGTDPTNSATAVTYSAAVSVLATTTMKFYGSDLAGNQSDVATKTYTVDLVAPNVTPFTLTAPFDDAVTYYASSTGSMTIVMQTDEDATYSIEIGGSAMGGGTVLRTGSATASVNVNIVLAGSEFTVGTQTLRAWAKDTAGNISTAVDTPIVIDDTADQPTLYKPLVGWSIKTIGANNVTFTWANMNTVETTQSGSGAKEYHLYISTDFAFTAPTMVTTNANSETQTLAAGRYFWKLRFVDNVNNTSTWSAARPLYVGRAATDITGNNLEDLLVGAPGYNTDQGRVYVYQGSTTCPTTCGASLLWATIEGPTGETTPRFGESVAIIPDINDGSTTGQADILIGSPQGDDTGKTNAGKIYVFLGENLATNCTTNGGANVNNGCVLNATNADFTIVGSAGGSYLGRQVSSVGDFNNDGLGDFAAAAPLETGNFSTSGVVYTYYGHATDPTGADLIMRGYKSSENFGGSVCNAGDLNGDGSSELFVGATAGDYSSTLTNTGVGYLFLGGSSADNVYDVKLRGSQTSTASFGNSCARLYDVNNDGFEEVIVGANQDAANFGKAYVFYGATTVLQFPGTQLQAGTIGGNFGTSVLGLFSDGDTRTDAMVGAPGFTAGSLIMYSGTSFAAPAFTGTPTQEADPAAYDTTIGGATTANALGLWGDLDASGQDVFVYGDPANNRILIYRGTSASRIIFTGAAGQEFGYSVSTR